MECDWCDQKATRVWVAVEEGYRDVWNDGVLFTCPRHVGKVYGVVHEMNLLFRH